MKQENEPTRRPEGEGWVWGQYLVKGRQVWAWNRHAPKPYQEGASNG